MEACFTYWRPEICCRDQCWNHLLIIYISDLNDNVVGMVSNCADTMKFSCMVDSESLLSEMTTGSGTTGKVGQGLSDLI